MVADQPPAAPVAALNVGATPLYVPPTPATTNMIRQLRCRQQPIRRWQV
jgi:hypothetical protein